MQYENHQVPEHINHSDEHPIKDFGWMLLAVGALIVTILLLVHLCAKLFAPFIPFEYETKISAPFVETLSGDTYTSDEQQKIQEYLENLVVEITPSADLPDGMKIIVHYSDDETVNAFATLGGNIVIFRGLFERIESENALVMLLGHEIAHVKHRDPIVSLSRGLISSIALGMLTGSSNSSVLDSYLGTTGLMTQLAFSRGQEEDADELAIKMVKERYQHTEGAEGLFKEFQSVYDGLEPPAFINSHPQTDDRIERIQATQDGNGELTPLPDYVLEYFKGSDSEEDE